MSLLSSLKPGGRHGVPSTESRDPIGYLVAGLNRLAQSDLIDRVRLRKPAEQAVFSVTRDGFKTLTKASRTFAKAGAGKPGARPARDRRERGLRPDPDRGRADARRRRHRVRRRGRCAPPPPRPTRPARRPRPCSRPVSRSACRSSASPRRSAASPRSARPWPAPSSPRRSPKGDMGLAVAALAPGSVATALGLWGTDAQQQTYLPAFTGDDVPAAALALTEPAVLFDVLSPSTTATQHRRRLRARRRQDPRRPRRPGRAVRGRRLARGQAGAVPRRVRRPPAWPSRATRRWACAPPRSPR